MSTRARKRHEKAQGRAAALLERTEKKVALSKDQSRTIQGRRKAWEEVNQHVLLGSSSSNINNNGGTKRKVRHDEGNTDESESDDEMAGVSGERGSRQKGGADEVVITMPATIETAINQDGGDDDDGDGDGIL